MKKLLLLLFLLPLVASAAWNPSITPGVSVTSATNPNLSGTGNTYTLTIGGIVPEYTNVNGTFAFVTGTSIPYAVTSGSARNAGGGGLLFYPSGNGLSVVNGGNDQVNYPNGNPLATGGGSNYLFYPNDSVFTDGVNLYAPNGSQKLFSSNGTYLGAAASVSGSQVDVTTLSGSAPALYSGTAGLALSSLSATTATNSLQLGGTAASSFATTSGSYNSLYSGTAGFALNVTNGTNLTGTGLFFTAGNALAALTAYGIWPGTTGTVPGLTVGTATTITGTIPASQVSGTIAQSGTSAYAAQSGTSQFAATSSTATTALTSSTANTLAVAPRTLVYWESSSIAYGPVVSSGTVASSIGGSTLSMAADLAALPYFTGSNTTTWNDGVPSGTSAMALARYSGTGNPYNGLVTVPSLHSLATSGSYGTKYCIIETGAWTVNDGNTGYPFQTSLNNFVAFTGSCASDGVKVIVVLASDYNSQYAYGFNQAILSGTGGANLWIPPMDMRQWMPNPFDTNFYSNLTAPLLCHLTVNGCQFVAQELESAFRSKGQYVSVSPASFQGGITLYNTIGTSTAGATMYLGTQGGDGFSGGDQMMTFTSPTANSYLGEGLVAGLTGPLLVTSTSGASIQFLPNGENTLAAATFTVNGPGTYTTGTVGISGNLTVGGLTASVGGSLFATDGAGSVIIGPSATITGSPGNSTAVGVNANASGNEATAVGRNALANNLATVAYGEGASATGSIAVAIGPGCVSAFTDSIALGVLATTTANNQIMIGGLIASVYPNVVIPNNLAVGGLTSTTGSGNIAITGTFIGNGFLLTNLPPSASGTANALVGTGTNSGTLIITGSNATVGGALTSGTTTQSVLTQLGAGLGLVATGSVSTTGTATTSFVVSTGITEPNTTYQVFVTPTSAIAAAVYYISAKSTTSFTVTYLAGLTGAVAFDWITIP